MEIAIPPVERQATAAPAVKELLRHEQLRLVYDYLPASQLVAVINGVLLVAVQSVVIKAPVLIGWLYALCMVTLIRILGGIAFRHAPPAAQQMPRWRHYAILGAACSGAVWGAAALLLFPGANVAHQVFVAFVLGGMVAGSVATLAPVLPAFFSFAVLALVPIAARFALEQELIQYAMAWMVVLFFAAMAIIARRSHRGMSDALALKFQNTVLIGELIAAQESLRRSHEELELRVEERTLELSRTNAELERLAYVASHDLQEPLRNAANFALLLESRYRERLDADGREFLGYIVGGVKHMRELVDGLLFHSRMGATPRVEATDCEALLGRVLSGLKTAITESAATVTHDPLPVVPGDPAQLEQVFSNLLSNALKFRGSAAPRVHLGVARRGDGWEFWVDDNGIGIDPRYAGQIFEMFERLHSHAQIPGTGMGLAICRKVVENHHGRIWLDPGRSGAGARFVFTLPGAGGKRGAERGGGGADRGPAGRGQPG
jgi:signal transduction histidine kinase